MTSLTFIGILSLLTLTSAEQFVCRNISGKSDLDVKRVYNGRWYLTNLDKAMGPKNPCIQFKNDVQEDGTVNSLISVYDKTRKSEFDTFHCKTNMKDIIGGKAILKCQDNPRMSDIDYIIESTMLDTDYDNYSVSYFCTRQEDLVTGGYILIMHRDKNAEPSNPKILELLKSLGLNMETFISRKNADCKEDPNF